MNSHFECSICSDTYIVPTRIPRGCSKCGNNVCEQCLESIKTKVGAYNCPFCKSSTAEIWAKNLPLIQILEENSTGMVCAQHKKKIVSLCCSPTCKLPAGICDRADCSRMHQEFGTNSLPVSLLCEENANENTQELDAYIDHMYREFEESIIKLLRQRKAKPTGASNLPGGDSRSKILRAMTLSSFELSLMKSEVMTSESKIKSSRDQILKKQQQKLAEDLISNIRGLRINYDNIIKVEPETKPELKLQKPLVATGDKYEFLYGFISQIIGKKFTASRIFDSQTDDMNNFKKVMAGQTNILYRVELEDGIIFGSYLKAEFPRVITADRQFRDPAAFIYWQNERTYFPAERNTISQFDVSRNFLLSVGNTNHWDGFWMEKNFRVLNPGRDTLTMVSDQYTGLFISFSTNYIRRFEAIRLNIA